MSGVVRDQLPFEGVHDMAATRLSPDYELLLPSVSVYVQAALSACTVIAQEGDVDVVSASHL